MSPSLRFVLALVVAGLLCGCDTSVDPIAANDQYYSVYALLDPAADTQFVRVEALRDSTPIGAPDALDATVTLARTGGGPTVSLQDSLARAGRVPTHLFWTRTRLTPGAEYRVTVTRSDGAASTATTTLPEAAPTLSFDNGPLMPCQAALRENLTTFTIFAQATERLAGAYVLYPVFQTLRRFNKTDRITREGGQYEVPVNHVDDLQSIGGREGALEANCPIRASFAVDSVFVAVATAGPNWPASDSASIDEIARPDRFDNVTNGTGYVGGIYTDTLSVPIEWDTD